MSDSFRPQAAVALFGAVFLLAALVVSAGGVAGTGARSQQTGGTFVEAEVGAPRFVNPLLARSDTDLDLTHLVFSGLMRVDEHGRIVPDLASALPDSTDATVYTFTLRPDLLWSDGRPLTSDDVIFTIGLLQDPNFPGDPALAAPWHNVQVSAPTAQQVVITLPAPDASFPQYSSLGILPRHLWQEIAAPDLAKSNLNTQPVGSGPWRYVPGGELPAQDQPPGAQDTPVAGMSSAETSVLLEPNPNN